MGHGGLQSQIHSLQIQSLSQIFQHVTLGVEAVHTQLGLCQVKRKALDNATEFQTLSAKTGWNASALFPTWPIFCNEWLNENLLLYTISVGPTNHLLQRSDCWCSHHKLPPPLGVPQNNVAEEEEDEEELYCFISDKEGGRRGWNCCRGVVKQSRFTL